MDVLLPRKTEFPMRPGLAGTVDIVNRPGNRRSITPSPQPNKECSLVPLAVHVVDIDLQPATQLPPYSLARKKTQPEGLARELDRPGILTRALAAVVHATLGCESVSHPAIPEQ